MTGKTCAILGLGLMGGSLARDLRALGWRVLGHDRDPGTLERALTDGIVDAPAAMPLPGGPAGEPGIRIAVSTVPGVPLVEADVVVLAVPVGTGPALLRRVGPLLAGSPRPVLVTDVGSTKAPIVDAAVEAGLGSRFVGSHPLTGHHTSGWTASRTGLYAGARVFLCPTPESGPAALDLVRRLWTSVGASCQILQPRVHDVELAWASHLPQVVSSALAVTLAREGTPHSALGPGGRDVTRLAASSPDVWTDILLDSAGELGRGLRAVADELRRVARALEARSEPEVRAFLEEGRDWVG